jgi:hypothetical protein
MDWDRSHVQPLSVPQILTGSGGRHGGPDGGCILVTKMRSCWEESHIQESSPHAIGKEGPKQRGQLVQELGAEGTSGTWRSKKAAQTDGGIVGVKQGRRGCLLPRRPTHCTEGERCSTFSPFTGVRWNQLGASMTILERGPEGQNWGAGEMWAGLEPFGSGWCRTRKRGLWLALKAARQRAVQQG